MTTYPIKPWYQKSGKILLLCKYIAISEELSPHNVNGVRWRFVGNGNVLPFTATIAGLDGLAEIAKYLKSHGVAVPDGYGTQVLTLKDTNSAHLHPFGVDAELYKLTAVGCEGLHGIGGLSTCPRYVTVRKNGNKIDFNIGYGHYSYHVAVKNAILTYSLI